ncbi:Hypothetical predicted protein [Mytilus galloprovincialis]|uniref:C1q domain-containing protein n=1 Tax=Mytilus galloprovincialis TaxID=29158 RepID=A0A8B6G6B5_MYTGA|nr:Hypothetical predicted protein [Mytilus galloprovincialis]
MCYIILVISIVVVVSGQEESKQTAFLDRDVNALIEINSKILKENENLKNLIDTLADKNIELERRVNFIEKNVQFLKKEGTKNGFERNIQENINDNLTEKYGQVNREIAKKNYPMLMSRNLKDKNHTKDKRHTQRETTGEVAFSAKVSDTLQNLGDHQYILFKTVDVDTHNAFHGDTGIFTVPVAGYYAVFATILTYPGVRVEFQIIHNAN